jgi:hypothetical protein
MGQLWKLIKILSTNKFKLDREDRDYSEHHENGKKHENHVDFQVHVFEDEEHYERDEPKEIIY